MRKLQYINILFSIMLICGLSSWSLPDVQNRNENTSGLNKSSQKALRDRLAKIVSDYPGEIGVAIIYNDNDTIAVNNQTKYPMMSVFKLHQGISTYAYLKTKKISLDSVVKIPRILLNADTWSPMLKETDRDTINISYRDLLRYAIEQSDNNASNYLFETILEPKEVESHIASILPGNSFKITYSEAEMCNDHSRAYANRTSPVAAASLINLLYTTPFVFESGFSENIEENVLNLEESQNMNFIKECLDNCKTGNDRISAPLLDKKDVTVGHKTGSGFRDNGILSAHNDVAFIRISDNLHYSLAVFVKDYPGDERQASAIIARISAVVYD